MGVLSPKTNRAKLVDDVDVLISKYSSVANLNELDTSALLDEVMDVMHKHYITIPGKYTILVRSIITIEGVLEEFCPDMNLFSFLAEKLIARVKKEFDLEQELKTAGKDLMQETKKAADIRPKTPNGMPLLAVFGLVFSVALGIVVVRRMQKKK